MVYHTYFKLPQSLYADYNLPNMTDRATRSNNEHFLDDAALFTETGITQITFIKNCKLIGD